MFAIVRESVCLNVKKCGILSLSLALFLSIDISLSYFSSWQGCAFSLFLPFLSFLSFLSFFLHTLSLAFRIIFYLSVSFLLSYFFVTIENTRETTLKKKVELFYFFHQFFSHTFALSLSLFFYLPLSLLSFSLS